MERINSALKSIDDLEDQAEEREKRMRVLEEEVEELKLKVCQCVRAEEEIGVSKEVRDQ